MSAAKERQVDLAAQERINAMWLAWLADYEAQVRRGEIEPIESDEFWEGTPFWDGEFDE